MTSAARFRDPREAWGRPGMRTGSDAVDVDGGAGVGERGGDEPLR
jgi:hypothetical protein